MRPFLLSILLSCSLSVQAQLPIERLDSFATEIRKIELAADGEIYADANSKKHILHLPEECFGFSYADGLAWKAVTKGADGYLTTEITEGIELSKATGLVIDFSNNKASTIHMYFPEGAIKTVSYRDDGKVDTSTPGILEFFFRSDKNEKAEGEDYVWEKLFFLLGDLVLRAQEKKGMITRQAAIAQAEELKVVNLDGLSTARHDAFLEKYPNSIFKRDVIQMRDQKKKAFDFYVKLNSGTYGDKGEMKVYAKGYDFFLSVNGKELPLTTKNYAIYYCSPQNIQLSFQKMNNGKVTMELIQNGETNYFDKL